MKGLGELAAEYKVPAQSHLSENLSEIGWVKELCPWSTCYGDAYDHFGLLGEKTIMAHCVYSTDEEVDLLRRTGTYIAHCPQSNAQLASGIAPIRRYLDLGMNVGLATDVAGGADLSMWRCMADAVAVSKLRWRLVDQSLSPLTTQEAFWMATMGGGSFRQQPADGGRGGQLSVGAEIVVAAVCPPDARTRACRRAATASPAAAQAKLRLSRSHWPFGVSGVTARAMRASAFAAHRMRPVSARRRPVTVRARASRSPCARRAAVLVSAMKIPPETVCNTGIFPIRRENYAVTRKNT